MSHLIPVVYADPLGESPDGHVWEVPKDEYSRFYDLETDEYVTLMVCSTCGIKSYLKGATSGCYTGYSVVPTCDDQVVANIMST